jgi:hypothetical protein
MRGRPCKSLRIQTACCELRPLNFQIRSLDPGCDCGTLNPCLFNTFPLHLNANKKVIDTLYTSMLSWVVNDRSSSRRYHHPVLPFCPSLPCFHTVTNCPPLPLAKHPLHFHALTNCKLRNPFVLIFIQNARGCTPLSARYAPKDCPNANDYIFVYLG